MLYYYLKHCFKAYLIWTFKYKEFKAPATFCLIIFKSFNIKYITGNISKQDTYSFIFPFNGKIKLKTANIQTSLFFFFFATQVQKKDKPPWCQYDQVACNKQMLFKNESFKSVHIVRARNNNITQLAQCSWAYLYPLHLSSTKWQT